MTVAKEEAWGFCQRKTCKTTRVMVWTDEEYPHESFLSQNRRQIVGKCVVCGNTLCRFASNMMVVCPLPERTEQQELEEALADTWREYGKQGRNCPRCGGYMRGAKGSGLEIDNNCINCGYAGPVLYPAEDIRIRNSERFQSPKRFAKRRH
jgi:hypothetical protein